MDRSNIHFKFLGPLHDDDTLVEIILPAEVLDLGILCQAIQVDVKYRIFCVIDVHEREGRAANLMDIDKAQAGRDPLGKNGLSGPQFPCQENDLLSPERFGQRFCQVERLLRLRGRVGCC